MPQSETHTAAESVIGDKVTAMTCERCHGQGEVLDPDGDHVPCPVCRPWTPEEVFDVVAALVGRALIEFGDLQTMRTPESAEVVAIVAVEDLPGRFEVVLRRRS